ncbi:hypothetical protein Hte_011777 [Hypoxylon texense]
MAATLLAAVDYTHNYQHCWPNSAIYPGHEYDGIELVDHAQAAGGATSAIAFVTLVLDMAEMLLYYDRFLRSLLLACSAGLKTVVWGAYSVLTIVNNVPNVLAIVLGLVLAVTSAEQLVYGSQYKYRQ